MKEKKFGLLVQGPISSPGFGPYGWMENGKYDKRWINYDAYADVEKWIIEGQNYFSNIVVSTWDYPDIDILQKFCKDFKVDLIVNHENERLREAALTTHKYHQITTSLSGIEALRNRGCNVVAKVRTDHRLDVKVLWKQLEKHATLGLRNHVGVPYMSLYELNRLTDFYWVGNIEVLQRIFHFYLNSPEYSDDTHEDYFMNFIRSGIDFNHPDLNSTSLKGKYLSLKQLVQLWTENFYPLERKLYESLHWRGQKIDHRANRWIRWFYLMVPRKYLNIRICSTVNFLMVGTVRVAKRPFIRITSFFHFRKSKRKMS